MVIIQKNQSMIYILAVIHINLLILFINIGLILILVFIEEAIYQSEFVGFLFMGICKDYSLYNRTLLYRWPTGQSNEWDTNYKSKKFTCKSKTSEQHHGLTNCLRFRGWTCWKLTISKINLSKMLLNSSI